MKPGQVAKIFFRYSAPPKTKICLCVCLEPNSFLIISSKAYPFAPQDSQVKIFKNELECLDYDSWIDVSKIYSLEMEDIVKGEAKGVWNLSQSAIERIKYHAKNQITLSPIQKRIIENNL